jgi:carboxyl-terminal processing protease
MLLICLTFGIPLLAYGQDNSRLAEVRELLREDYVEPVSECVLSGATIQEMLKRLGDPHTQYLTIPSITNF